MASRLPGFIVPEQSLSTADSRGDIEVGGDSPGKATMHRKRWARLWRS